VANRRQNIDPPTFTPSQYGLLTVAQTPPSADAHWMNGVTYQTRCINSADTIYDACIAVTGTGPPPAAPSKTNNTSLVFRGATPFTVYTEFACAPIGIADAQQIATDALAQSAPWEVEYAFWTGKAANQNVVYPHLAAGTQVLDADSIILQSAATTVTGSAVNVRVGIGLLEEAIGNCSNGQGVIHVQRKVLSALFFSQLVESRGGQLFTKSGNLVAVGSGYPGTGPTGQAITAITSWMFATGTVFAMTGPVRVLNQRETLDRTTNTVAMLAERTYLLGWDCCHAAVQVDISAA